MTEKTIQLPGSNTEILNFVAALVASARDAVVGTDLDGAVVTWNFAAERLSGYTADEMLGRPVEVTSLWDEIGGPAYVRDALVHGKAIPRYDTALLAKSGTAVPVGVTISPVYDSAGVLAGVSTIAREVDAEQDAKRLADLERLLARHSTDLARAEEYLQSFVYSVSHDLRSPIRAMTGFSAALEEDCADQLDEAGRGYLARIQAAGLRLGTLIEDLLILSRLAQAPMELQRVNLSAVATETAADLQRSEPARRARFVIQDGVTVTADPSLIASVVARLMDNAWKFTSGREEAVIEFGVEPCDGGVCCYVRDNGVGFDPMYSGKLFQPFQRLHSADEYPGDGIGLAAVRRIVERHGGRVWADGSVDGGATVYFTIAISEDTSHGPSASIERDV